MSIWETEIFQGIKPTPIHVADWRKQAMLLDEENERATCIAEEIEYDHGERTEPETGRTIPYRVVYERIETTPATKSAPAKYDLKPTAVYIPVSEADEIVYLVEGEGDAVDIYRRQKERKRAEKEQKQSIRYRREQMRRKGDKAEKFDLSIAIAGAGETDTRVITEMVVGEKGKKKG
jgi:hypothetical protein